jgi:hypothetical protein
MAVTVGGGGRDLGDCIDVAPTCHGSRGKSTARRGSKYGGSAERRKDESARQHDDDEPKKTGELTVLCVLDFEAAIISLLWTYLGSKETQTLIAIVSRSKGSVWPRSLQISSVDTDHEVASRIRSGDVVVAALTVTKSYL